MTWQSISKVESFIIYWIASATPRNDRGGMDCRAAAIALLAMNPSMRERFAFE